MSTRRTAERAPFVVFPPLPRLLIPSARPPVIVKAEGASQPPERFEDDVDRTIRRDCVTEFASCGADAALAERFAEELRALDAALLRPTRSRSDATLAPAALQSTMLVPVKPLIEGQLNAALEAAVREALAADPLELMIVLKQVWRAIELAASAHERTPWWWRGGAGEVREVLHLNLIPPLVHDLTDEVQRVPAGAAAAAAAADVPVEAVAKRARPAEAAASSERAAAAPTAGKTLGDKTGADPDPSSATAERETLSIELQRQQAESAQPSKEARGSKDAAAAPEVHVTTVVQLLWRSQECEDADTWVDFCPASLPAEAAEAFERMVAALERIGNLGLRETHVCCWVMPDEIIEPLLTQAVLDDIYAFRKGKYAKYALPIDFAKSTPHVVSHRFLVNYC